MRKEGEGGRRRRRRGGGRRRGEGGGRREEGGRRRNDVDDIDGDDIRSYIVRHTGGDKKETSQYCLEDGFERFGPH